MLRKIYDTILLLESLSLRKRFPLALLSADTDMVTCGWESLTSMTANEVVIAQLNKYEFDTELHDSDRHEGYRLFQKRINSHMRRTDLRSVWIEHIERKKNPSRFFPDPPPVAHYRDIFSAGSSAVEVSRMSLEAFEATGGEVFVIES